ncbi:MAG: hypothetical protein C0402_10675 [Thermodesulfovibrio sp.]|nr:hypothetical protein [Thermodesulfovibrio sp.]
MSIRTKLILLFTAFAIVTLTVFGTVVFFQASEILRSVRIAQLNNIADLKKDKIETFYRERESDIRSAQNLFILKQNLPLLIRHITDRNLPEYNSEYNKVRGIIDDQIKTFQQSSGSYLNIMLVDPQGSIVYISNTGHDVPALGKRIEDERAFLAAKNAVFFTDVHLDRVAGNTFEIRALGPLRDLKGAFIGIIVIDIDMSPIYQSLQDTTGLGTTGEALIAQKQGNEVLFLSPLRHAPDAALKKRVPFTNSTGYAAQKAAHGENGSGIAFDYAEKEVLAAWRYIPSLRWGLVTKIETSEAFAPVGQLKTIFVVVGALIVFLGIIAAIFIANTVTGPVLALQKGAEAITAGNLSHRVGTDANDEIGRLAQSFDTMTETLVRDITRREKAEEEAMELNKNLEHHVRQLEESIRELDAFSYSVSHDLRSPLRSIDGFSQALLEDYKDKLDAEGRDFLDRIRGAAQRMSQLIDDLLKLSRIARFEMKQERVDLGSLANSIAQKLTQRQPERTAEIVIADGLIAQGDERLLTIVLENLFANAWKFSETQTKTVIEFGTSLQSGSLVYFIRDNGVGFDMSYAEKLFSPFQRLHRQTEFAGTGIGLATVKRIINRHGGRVWIESETNKGTTVYFTL